MIATDDPLEGTVQKWKRRPQFLPISQQNIIPSWSGLGKPNVSREGNALCPSGIKQQLLANSYITQTKTYDGVGDG